MELYDAIEILFLVLLRIQVIKSRHRKPVKELPPETSMKENRIHPQKSFPAPTNS